MRVFVVFGNLFKFVFCCYFFSHFTYSFLYQKHKKNKKKDLEKKV